ncbi:MAG: phosphatase PAP2 family protein [bacterium]|nr:phosphatase PAP2 family protein [bacterium]
MDALIIFAAKYLIYIVAAIFVVYFFLARRRAKRKLLLLSALSLPLAYVVGWLAGLLYYNPQPFALSGIAPLVSHAANNGFPSDHMLFAAALAMLVLFFSRPLGILLWVLALLVGFARIAAGVHHTADIIAAAAIAALVVWLVHLCVQGRGWYRG